jgi:hypothetical protein
MLEAKVPCAPVRQLAAVMKDGTCTRVGLRWIDHPELAASSFRTRRSFEGTPVCDRAELPPGPATKP